MSADAIERIERLERELAAEKAAKAAERAANEQRLQPSQPRGPLPDSFAGELMAAQDLARLERERAQAAAAERFERQHGGTVAQIAALEEQIRGEERALEERIAALVAAERGRAQKGLDGLARKRDKLRGTLPRPPISLNVGRELEAELDHAKRRGFRPFVAVTDGHAGQATVRLEPASEDARRACRAPIEANTPTRGSSDPTALIAALRASFDSALTSLDSTMPLADPRARWRSRR